MRKVFILTQFGTPHPWTQQYLDSVGRLEKDGWHWKIFTPNTFERVPSNVEIVPMTLEQFNALVLKTCGVSPKNTMQNGLPVKPISDYYVASGVIFQEYIQDYDYWGITNWDVVYGEIAAFLPNGYLFQWDIWSDDVNAINGVFSLYRNTATINNLFRLIPDWERKFEEPTLFGMDELDFTEVVRKEAGLENITFGFPQHYPLHSHDRLEIHRPTPKLSLKGDGSLYELIQDVQPPQWAHTRPYFGREIMYFHFSQTKVWPTL